MIAGRHSLSYPLSFLSRYLVRSLVYLPYLSLDHIESMNTNNHRMEQCNDTEGNVFYMGARTEWLPAEQFMNINNWDESLKPLASHYIKEVEEWIASKEDGLAGKVLSVKQEGEGSTISIKAATNLMCEKPYACSQCGKSFAWRSRLANHLRTHSGEKPYACSECGKSFAQKRYLTKHLRLHSGEKPFSCSQCGKSFAWRSSLTNHLRTHSGEKPYVCSQCGESFGHQSNLAKHIHVHSEEKPFSCSQFGKAFGQKSHLTQHLRIHSKAIPCSRCGQTFTRKARLARHFNSGCMINYIDGIITK